MHIFQELNADADYGNLCIVSTFIKAHLYLDFVEMLQLV